MTRDQKHRVPGLRQPRKPPPTNWASIILPGGILLLAALFVALAGDWYALIHRHLGLGEFPDAPVSWYLARSASSLYAFHGLLVAGIALRPHRVPWMVDVLGAGNMLFGMSMIGIDISAGMPWWWTLAEGPGIAVFGAILIMLNRLANEGRTES